jgi:hypothetical protein
MIDLEYKEKILGSSKEKRLRPRNEGFDYRKRQRQARDK